MLDKILFGRSRTLLFICLLRRFKIQLT